MTGDVVNLRTVRKQKARADREKQADQNRVSFGRTKSEKTLTRRLNDQIDRRLEQGRRDPVPGEIVRNDRTSTSDPATAPEISPATETDR